SAIRRFRRATTPAPAAPARGAADPRHGPPASRPHPPPRAAQRHRGAHRLRPPGRDRARSLPPLPAPVRAAPPPPGDLRAPRQPRLLPPRRSTHPRAARRRPRTAADPAQPRHRPAQRCAGPARDQGGRRMSTSPTTPPSAVRTEAPTLGARLRASVSRSRTLWPAREDYRLLPRTWRQDLVAGVTVGIVALPLALGFGVSSGLTAEQGLVTAIIAGLL